VVWGSSQSTILSQPKPCCDDVLIHPYVRRMLSSQHFAVALFLLLINVASVAAEDAGNIIAGFLIGIIAFTTTCACLGWYSRKQGPSTPSI
jgi:hypothetical protein